MRGVGKIFQHRNFSPLIPEAALSEISDFDDSARYPGSRIHWEFCVLLDPRLRGDERHNCDHRIKD